MSHAQTKVQRVLAVSPSSKGVGYAVLERGETLVDWGVKSLTQRDKNSQSLRHIEALIQHYHPDVLVMQDFEGKNTRRAPRIQALGNSLSVLAEASGVTLARLTRTCVARQIAGSAGATKHEVASVVAGLFPDELRARLPRKRRLWDSEDSRMDMFDAVALALTIAQRGVARSRKECG